MKAIVAFIRPSKEKAVRIALHNLPDVTGATFSDVRGFGRNRGQGDAVMASPEAVLDALPKVRLDVMVADVHAENIRQVIAAAARTGHRGDGKIYILPAESALRVSSGKTGAAVI